jgi:hypothetical protein
MILKTTIDLHPTILALIVYAQGYRWAVVYFLMLQALWYLRQIRDRMK